MADNSSLYGTGGSNAGVSSSNFTTLYSGGGGKLPGGDNVIINGTLTVNGCSILTDCTAFNLLPFNATTVNAFGAATALQLGDTTGVTTIQNQLATANYAFPLADGVSGQVLVTNGSGQLSFAAASTVGKTYSIDASTTVGGANFNLVSSDPSTDTIKFASGTGITVSRTDANTITITNSDPGSTGVTSITGTANQVIASSPTGAVTLSLPQSIATTSNPVFAGVTGGNVTVGVVDNNTVATTTGNLIIGDATQTTNWVVINSAAAVPVAIQRFTTGTNTEVRSLALAVQSSGTPTVGFGNQLEFQLEAQPGNTERAGYVSVVSTDLTAGSEDFKMSFGLMQNGAVVSEKANIDSAGNLVLDGGINADSGTLFVDATTNRIGINNLNPQYELHIDQGADGFTQIGMTTAERTALWTMNDGDDLLSLSYGSPAPGFNRLQFSPTDQWFNFGNTGFNTATPAYTLDVNGQGNFQGVITGGLKINGATTGYSNFISDPNGSTLNYQLPGTAGAANTVLTNDGSGNLSWALPGGGGSTFGNITVGVETDNTISTTTGDLVLNSTSGIIQMNSAGTLGFTLTPITGQKPNADFTGNIVKGQIRTGAGEANGNIFEFLGATTPSTGISIDNTDKVADRTSLVIRNYGGSLAGGNPRGNIIFEAARGTAASPTNLNSGNVIGDILANGYTSTGWTSDLSTTVPALARFYTTEAWNNGLNNVGTGFRVILTPNATALSAGNLVTALQSTATTNGGVLTMAGFTANTTAGGPLVSIGDVPIVQMASSWQTSVTPGYKYVGLMDSATQTANGSTFEMSSRWKASAGTTTYDPPQTGWGLGNFSFSADSSTTNTSQVTSGVIKTVATENWSGSATGSKLVFQSNRAGVFNNSVNVLDMSPETTKISSDIITLEDSTGNDYLTLDATSATFTQDVFAPTLTVDGRSTIDTYTITTTATTTIPIIATSRNVIKVIVYIVEGANVHTVEALALRVNGSTAMLTTYAEMYNTTPLATFTADVSGGDLRLLATPTSATSTVFSAVRTSLT